ncbi:UNVERIFIED_CONTAM: hypothetical protein FKN15_055319 [Acipenser sinensis]
MQPPKSYNVGGQRSSRAAYRQACRRPARLQGLLPPDPSTVPLRAEDLRHGDTGGYGETLPLRDCQIRCGDAGKLSAGYRRGETTDSVLMQNGGGGGGRIAGAERDLQLQLLKKHSNQKQQKDWDKLRVEEKEAEIHAKKVSKNIDRALKEQKREYKQTHRLLLLVQLPRAVAKMTSELHAASLGTVPSQSGPPNQLSTGQAYLLN